MTMADAPGVCAACQPGVMRSGSRWVMSSFPRDVEARARWMVYGHLVVAQERLGARRVRRAGGVAPAGDRRDGGGNDGDLLRLVHRRHLGLDPHPAGGLDVQ